MRHVPSQSNLIEWCDQILDTDYSFVLRQKHASKPSRIPFGYQRIRHQCLDLAYFLLDGLHAKYSNHVCVDLNLEKSMNFRLTQPDSPAENSRIPCNQRA